MAMFRCVVTVLCTDHLNILARKNSRPVAGPMISCTQGKRREKEAKQKNQVLFFAL